MIVALDAETFWSQDYSLSRMTTAEYILDHRFQLIMLSLKIDQNPSEVLIGEKMIKSRLASLDWSKIAMLSHNVAFDGAILLWRLGITPAMYLDTLSMCRAITHWVIGKSALANVSDYLGLPPKGKEVFTFKGKRLENFNADELVAYANYCIRDNENCRLIFDTLRPHIPNSELRLIDLIARMHVQPQVKLNPNVLAEHLHQVRVEKQAILDQVGYLDPTVLSSQPQFARLLEQMGVEVPMKTSPSTGLPIPALSKNDRGFRELLADDSQPLAVQALLAARTQAKSTIEETRSERFLKTSMTNWPGRGQGWAPIPLKYYGARCVPGHVEVLTPDGWERLDAWEGGPIAQVDPDMGIEFLPATRFVGPVEGEWVKVAAPYLTCDFTPGHTVPYLKHYSYQWATLNASDILTRKSLHVPVAGTLRSGGAITPSQMRVLAMVQADGHWQTNTRYGRELRIKVKKQRKIERARQLFEATNVIYHERIHPSAPGYVRFVVSYVDWPSWLTPERKVFGSWLFDSTPEAREALMHELHHWDGCVQGGQICYSTSVKTNADWITTIAHMTGRCASVHHLDRGKGRTTNYRVQLRQRSTAMVFDKHVSIETAPQATYCATTQTGFFLARSNGRIFVTGNTGRLSGNDLTNWQNLKRGSRIREAIEAPPGMRIVHRDASQIEARMVAWMADCQHLLDAFAKGRDVYSEFASIIYGVHITSVDKLRRFVGKTAILGLGYGCGPDKFRHMLYIGNGGMSLKVDHDEAQRIVYAYRSRYAEIPRLWYWGSVVINRVVGESGRPSSNLLVGSHRWIPIEVGYDSVWLPNKMCLSYPDIRYRVDDTWDNRHSIMYRRPLGDNNWAKLYGAKFCLGADTQVLTDRGWIPIVEVTLRDRVWDGDEWVSHDGVAINGEMPVITVDGVTMTPDHEALTTEGWRDGSACEGYNRAPVWLPDRYAARWFDPNQDGLAAFVGDPLRLRAGDPDDSISVLQGHAEIMRVPAVSDNKRGAYDAWDVEAPGVCSMAVDDRPLFAADASGVGQLRRAGDYGLPRVALIRDVLERHGGDIQTRLDVRAQGQRGWVFGGELRVGNVSQADEQQARQRTDTDAAGRNDSSRSISSDRDRPYNIVVSDRGRSQPVYDIVNAGLRHRFVVAGKDGPFIVHNCENLSQALSRIIVTDIAVRMYDLTGCHPFLSTHDSLDYCVPVEEATWWNQELSNQFSMRPSWASNLPLASEGGWGGSLLAAERGVNK